MPAISAGIDLKVFYVDAKLALNDPLRDLKADSEIPISLYDIGGPLVGRGYEQDQVVNALYSLQSDGVIELIPGNRLYTKALRIGYPKRRYVHQNRRDWLTFSFVSSASL
ncbi:hypothetical protein [Rhizobium leguminosarum]